jgi:hypothetical protein
MEHEHGHGDGPAEKHLVVFADTSVSQEAVGAFTDPVDDVLSAPVPEETHADAKKGLIDTEMTANGRTVEHIKDEPPEGARDNDEQEGVSGLELLANGKATVMDAKIVALSKGNEGAM